MPSILFLMLEPVGLGQLREADRAVPMLKVRPSFYLGAGAMTTSPVGIDRLGVERTEATARKWANCRVYLKTSESDRKAYLPSDAAWQLNLANRKDVVECYGAAPVHSPLQRR
jgi:hypothetical protein